MVAGEINEKTRVSMSVPILVTIVGVIAGLAASNAVAQYRLTKTEERVEKVEAKSTEGDGRLIRLEESQRRIESDIRDIRESLRDLSGRPHGRSSGKP